MLGFRGLSQNSLMEVCKLMLAATCGYILKSMVDIPPAGLCPRCQECVAVPPHIEYANSNGTIRPPPPLHEPVKPHTMYEVLRYDFFTDKHLYNNIDDNPRIGLLAHQKQEIKDIVARAQALYNSKALDQWVIQEMLYGYKRIDPMRGVEYDLDVVLASQVEDRVERHRLKIVKPYAAAQLVGDKYFEQPKMIHFILPLANVTEHAKQFDAFIKNFEEMCQKSKDHIYLLIVMFLSKTAKDEKDVERVKSKTKYLSQRYAHAHLRTMQTYYPFSRALGIDLGTKQLPQEALLFFCDVDVVFTEEFLQRCRYNAVPEKQVYYPMVFAQYMPSMVTQYSPPEKSQDLKDISKYTGHWVHYGYGMTCLYNMDYHSVGGYNTSIQGWGGEDVDLYLRHVKSKNIQVFRAAEPGLVHIYHNKSCNVAMGTEKQQEMCAGSLTEGIGSKQQLASYILKQQQQQQQQQPQKPNPEEQKPPPPQKQET